MKKLIALCIGLTVMAGSLPVLAGGSSSPCKTKYAIVLVHGAFFKDENMLGINYWWGIPSALEDQGATVYVTNQDTFNGVPERAAEVATELGELFALNPKWKKVNLVGHSQGPLDCRYLVSNLSIPGKGAAKNYVASITSIAGTHHGSEVADALWYAANDWEIGPAAAPYIAAAVNAFASVFYYNEQDQNGMKLLYQLTHDFVDGTFNPMTPNKTGVYYQSWAGVVSGTSVTHVDDVIVGPLWALMNAMGAGDNDCLVSVESATWGKFRGELTGTSDGVNHFNEINHFFGITPGWDAPAFYVSVVKDLKKKGY
jgi:triacylglycerol lipase